MLFPEESYKIVQQTQGATETNFCVMCASAVCWEEKNCLLPGISALVWVDACVCFWRGPHSRRGSASDIQTLVGAHNCVHHYREIKARRMQTTPPHKHRTIHKKQPMASLFGSPKWFSCVSPPPLSRGVVSLSRQNK